MTSILSKVYCFKFVPVINRERSRGGGIAEGSSIGSAVAVAHGYVGKSAGRQRHRVVGIKAGDGDGVERLRVGDNGEDVEGYGAILCRRGDVDGIGAVYLMGAASGDAPAVEDIVDGDLYFLHVGWHCVGGLDTELSHDALHEAGERRGDRRGEGGGEVHGVRHLVVREGDDAVGEGGGACCLVAYGVEGVGLGFVEGQ